MTTEKINAIADAVTSLWSEESWSIARSGEYDGQDQDVVAAAAAAIGVDYEACVDGIGAVYQELTRRSLAR